MEIQKKLFILLFLVLMENLRVINSEICVKCLESIERVQKVLRDDRKTYENDQQIVSNKNKRPDESNINFFIEKQRYFDSPFQYGSEIKEFTSRDKRTPKKPESFASIRKKLNEEKKLKKEDQMAADGQPRLEPNHTGTRYTEPQYGGIKTEQNYNKNLDKMQMLKTISQADREHNYIMPELECNFERPCSWKWNEDDGFSITSGEVEGENDGPKTDFFDNVSGKINS